MKTALITGVTGQTGSYLAELLLAKDYIVHGIVRRSSSFNTDRIDHLYHDPHDPDRRLYLHYGDMLDASGLERLVWETRPDEVYNLAAQSHVRVSFDQPIYTADVVALGTLRLLEAVMHCSDRNGRTIKFYQASSSEMFGDSPPPQSINTPFRPRSPYAAAKVHAFHQTVGYREAYGLYAVNGVLFNHESPRRGETFVTRKITRAVGRIAHGLQEKLYLGNMSARRDWGHAKDYVEAIWRMLQQDEPRDYVVATGISHYVLKFAELAFESAGLHYYDHVEQDRRYYRPTEVDILCGYIEETTKQLDWRPTVTFEDLIHEMVEHDMGLASWERKKRDASD
jgi:GDPmannose 4,6-dehydratase